MEKEKFNQAKYMREWQKENMKQVKASYKTEFVDDFKEACRKLGIKQSDVFRNAMYSTIKKAEKIKMTREEIKQEIILDLEKAYEEKMNIDIIWNNFLWKATMIMKFIDTLII